MECMQFRLKGEDSAEVSRMFEGAKLRFIDQEWFLCRGTEKHKVQSGDWAALLKDNKLRVFSHEAFMEFVANYEEHEDGA